MNYRMKIFLVLLFCFLGNLSTANEDSEEDSKGAPIAMSDEKRLIKKLLDDYEKVGVIGRPVYDTSQTINVSYGLSLIQILDLDKKNQVLTTNVWSRYEWMDHLLKWDPENYGGVDLVRVPSTKIWTPDIVLYNYADMRLKEHREALVLVDSNGTVRWLPQAIFKSTCNIDITNFPFDIQKCHMKFGSWTYDGYKLDVNFLDLSSFDITEYVKSNEWDLLGSPAVKHVIYYHGLNEPYIDLTFFVIIKRVAVFYNYILVLPCVLLSFLTLVIFWLPPESPAKVMLGMSVFVAFFVLLLLLADSTPPASTSIPLIGAYFCANMILITLSTFLAVIIIQNHVRGDRKNKVPDWLKKVAIDGLAKVLCMSEFLDKDSQKAANNAKASRKSQNQRQQVNETHQYYQPRLGNYMHQSAMVPPLRSQPPHLQQQFSETLGSRRGMFKPYLGATNATSEEGALLSKSSCHLAMPAPSDQNLHYHPTQQTFSNQTGSLSAAPNNANNTTSTLKHNSSPVYLVGCSSSLESDVREIRKMLKAYVTRIENKDVSAKNAKEWRLVARVLDRIFFYAYIGTIIVSLCTIFPRDISDYSSFVNLRTLSPAPESMVTEKPIFNNVTSFP